MADLTEIQSTDTTKIIGSDSTGVEQAPVQSTSSGALHVNIRDAIGGALTSATTPLSNAVGLIVRPVSLEYATFSVIAEAIVIGNNKSMLALQNTGTSLMKIREIWLINDRTSAVTGVAGVFRVLRIGSFSGGTSLTPASFDTTDSLPSGMSAATNATVSGESDLLRVGSWSTDEWGPGTLDQEGLDHGFQNTFPFFKQVDNGKPIVVRQNQGVHVKFSTSSTAGYFSIRVIFTTE